MTATKSPDTENTGPLAGVTIVDCTSVVLGAYAMQILGDLGAEVIKIEAPTAEGSPGGDILRWGGKSPKGPGMGPLFMTYNRNKRSVMLDLKKEEAREALRTLIKDADVFASNIRYAGMERLGIDYDSVKKINPEIVY
ncbi:CoA transferase, partial [Roseovarius sp.]